MRVNDMDVIVSIYMMELSDPLRLIFDYINSFIRYA